TPLLRAQSRIPHRPTVYPDRDSGVLPHHRHLSLRAMSPQVRNPSITAQPTPLTIPIARSALLLAAQFNSVYRLSGSGVLVVATVSAGRRDDQTLFITSNLPLVRPIRSQPTGRRAASQVALAGGTVVDAGAAAGRARLPASA